MKILKARWKKSGKTWKKKKKRRKNRKQEKQKERVSLNTEPSILKQALIQRKNLEFKDQLVCRMI